MAYTAAGLFAVPKPTFARPIKPLGPAWQTPGGQIFGHGPVVDATPSYQAPSITPPYGTPDTTQQQQTPPPKATPMTSGFDTSKVASYAAPAGAAGNWNPNTDPFVSNLLSQQKTAAGKSGANLSQQAWNALLGFGSKELANAFIGGNPFSYIDPGDPTQTPTNPMGAYSGLVGTISDDPYNSVSTLGQENWGYLWGGGPLGQGSNIGVNPFNEAENEANLWYGGGRFLGLANAARQHQLNIGAETRAVQNQLDDLTSQWNAALGGYQSSYWDALKDAFSRHLTAGPGSSGSPDAPENKVIQVGPQTAADVPANAPYVGDNGQVQIPTIIGPGGQIGPLDTGSPAYGGPDITQTVRPWNDPALNPPAATPEPAFSWAANPDPLLLGILNAARKAGGKGPVRG